MKFRHSFRLLPFPAIILAGALAGPAALAASLTWTGGTNSLNSATNWVGNVTPTSGDSFIFGSAGAGGLLLNNDLASGAFDIGGITYRAGAAAFVIGNGTAVANAGNPFALTGPVSSSSVTLQTINAPFTVAAVQNISSIVGGGLLLAGNVSGTGGVVKSGSGTLSLTGANSYTGTTTVSSGILQVSGPLGTVSASTVVLSGGNLVVSNANAIDAAVNRLPDTAGIQVTNGGSLTLTNSAGPNLNYSEAPGAFTLAAGNLNLVLSNDQNNATNNNQMLTVGGLNRSGLTTTTTFSALGTAPNATTNMFKITGAPATVAGQILGSWATTGTTANLQTDYAVVDAAAHILPANIPASAETTWTGATDAYTLTGSTTLTATRTIHALRYSGSSATLTLGPSAKLETTGLLFAGNASTGLTVLPGAGGLLSTPTGGGQLFLTNGKVDGNFTITAPITDNAGAVSVVKSGAGSLQLGGTNTHTGGTTVNAGTLICGVNAAPLGAAGSINVTMAAGTTLGVNRTNFVGNLTLNGATVLGGNGFGDNLGGTIVLGATSIIDSISTGNITLSADISGAGGLSKNGGGNGLLTLSGTNTYSGPTVVNAGILKLTRPASLYNGVEVNWTAANLTVASGATLRLNVGGASDFSGAQVGTLLTGLTSGLTTDGLRGGSIIGLDTTNGNATIATAITDSSAGFFNFSKFGPNTLTLSGANTYSGKTTIYFGGALSVASLNSVNGGTPLLANSSLGAPTTVINGTIDLGDGSSSGGATLIYTGTGETTDRVLRMAGQGTNNHAIEQAGSGLLKFTSPFTINSNVNQGLTLTGSTAGTGEIAGALPLVGGTVTKNGTGTWTLSGANTYVGNTTVNAGTLKLAAGGQLKFVLGATSSITNSISGAGTAVLDGNFLIDTTAAAALTSGAWTLESVAGLTGLYGSTFSVSGFTPASNGDTWTRTASGKTFTFVESTGSLTLSLATNDYDIWLAGFPTLSAPADQLPTADPDGDGLKNQQEFAFGLRPDSGASVNPITSPLNKTTGVFSYTRRATSGLVYTVSTSTDLVNWSVDNSTTQTVITVGDVQTVTFTVSNAPVDGKLFVRVMAQ